MPKSNAADETSVIDEYKKLDEECAVVLAKIKARKRKKARAAKLVVINDT